MHPADPAPHLPGAAAVAAGGAANVSGCAALAAALSADAAADPTCPRMGAPRKKGVHYGRSPDSSPSRSRTGVER